MDLGWTLLLAVVGLVVIMAGSSLYFTWLMNKAVFSQLHVLDQIRTTRMPPEQWQRGYLRRARKRGRIDAKSFERQKRKNLKRLKSVERFAQKTTLMEDEQVREVVLRELGAIRQEWQGETPPTDGRG